MAKITNTTIPITPPSTPRPFQYNKSEINYEDVSIFENKKRSENDKNNKKREDIIGCILNDKIPKEYYDHSPEWQNLKQALHIYVNNLCETKQIHSSSIEHISCVHKAGRKHHYDLKLIINHEFEFNLEFKFNAECVKDTPQFVSPMKPSKYLETSYEEYFYDNYLVSVLMKYGLTVPPRDEYLKDIHGPSPPNMVEAQMKYYNGCKKSSKYSGNPEDLDFYETMKKVAHDSIYSFIENNKLKSEILTDYLLETQKSKYYMLYKNGMFHLETINQDEYIISSVNKNPKMNRYDVVTKTGNKLKILLRWKNGNGIAYPSFQIS